MKQKRAKLLTFFFFFGFAIIYSQPAFNEYNGRLSFSMDPAFAPFYHGVASGDPLSDRVIIWTRVTPLGPVDSIHVEWKIALDTLFTNIINQGNLYTNESKDYTVKVDVDGLQPDTWYYYHFKAFNTNSIIGRTKTVPVGDIDNVRFATVHGSNYNNGYFNVYNHLVFRNDFEAVIHKGDYIYEYGTDYYGNHPDRGLAPAHDCVTLSDYRMRYSHYRLDPDLRMLHQQYPWWVIWDDHESANNSFYDGAENHDPATQGNWLVRKAASVQAFLEWIPVREINDITNPDKEISRSVKYGDLAKVIFLDTRLEGRDDPEGLPVNDPNKTMLGQYQYDWFTNELFDAQYGDTAQWKIIVNQVVFAPLNFVAYTNKDQWDGYEVERQKILNYIEYYNINNTVIISGDIHTSWAFDVRNPLLGNYGSNGQGVTTVEFVSPSVTSPSIPLGGGIGAASLKLANPHLQWVNLVEKGYMMFDISKQKAQADWYYINDINNHGGYTTNFGQAWYVNNNQNHVINSSTPTTFTGTYQYLAPFFPSITVHAEQPSSEFLNNELVLLAAYPNPFEDALTLQLFSHKEDVVYIKIFSIDGKELYNRSFDIYAGDMYYHRFSVDNLSQGYYLLNLTSENGSLINKKILKQ